MVWEWCQCVLITITSLFQVWLRMVGLASTSTHCYPCHPKRDPSDLTGPGVLANSWVVLAHADCTKVDIMVWDCWQSVHILITSLYQVWVRMIGLASASTVHSPPKRGPLRFGLCWNAGQFVRGSSTCYLYGRYCDGLVVLPEFFNSESKPLPGLGNNGWPHFHINWLVNRT